MNKNINILPLPLTREVKMPEELLVPSLDIMSMLADNLLYESVETIRNHMQSSDPKAAMSAVGHAIAMNRLIDQRKASIEDPGVKLDLSFDDGDDDNETE